MWLMKSIYSKYILLLWIVILVAHTTKAQENSRINSSTRVGIVLGGGGALGYAHIGVLQALDEADIRPTFIAGTSMGALVGVLYAAGYTGEELLQIVREYKLTSTTGIINLSGKNSRRGLSNFARVRKMLVEKIPTNSFDSLSIPFACTASNVQTGELMIRSKGGQLTDWVLASASIPGIFQPQLIDNAYYCDGGLMDNLPVAAIPDNVADIVIAIDLVPTDQPETETYFSKEYTMVNVYGNFLLRQMSRQGYANADVVIRPNSGTRYGIMDFSQYQYFYQQGYDTMQAWLSEHVSQ